MLSPTMIPVNLPTGCLGILPDPAGCAVSATTTARAGTRLRCLALMAALAAPGPMGMSQEMAGRGSSLLAGSLELPDAPSFQVAASAAPPAAGAEVAYGTIAGTLLDAQGESIDQARVTLTRDGQTAAAGATPVVVVSGPDGRFFFPNLPPGSFHLSIAAGNFAPAQAAGELQPGEAKELPAITMVAATSTSVQVTATQTEIAEAQINQEEKQRVIGIFPNFYVSYIPDPVPLDPKQKFELAFKTMIDPVSFVLNGVGAGIQQATNTYNWGQGAQGFGKRYAADYGTFLTGTLIGSAILPSILHQDPRYYYKGKGTITSRALYAIANSVVCKGDNHHWQPNYSAIMGGLAASGISNFYYPAVNRAGPELTFEGAAIGTGVSAISNLIQEFVVKRLTPHLPPNVPVDSPKGAEGR